MLISFLCFRQPKEDSILKQPHSEEGCLVFEGGCLPRASRTRKIPCGAKKVETFALKFPVPRTRVKAVEKQSWAACGEKTTFQGTYTGVQFRLTAELPLLSMADKKKMFRKAGGADLEDPPEDWQERYGQDVPLFWAESKPAGFWTALLADFQIQCVLDMTPGSGCLLESCLASGVMYHGLCLGLRKLLLHVKTCRPAFRCIVWHSFQLRSQQRAFAMDPNDR